MPRTSAATTITWSRYHDDGSEEDVSLPAKFEVCGHCEGRGTSSAHLGAFSREEMDEQGPEFLEDYLRGAYDRPCPECQGKRVVAVLDRKACPPDLLKVYDGHLSDEAEYQALCEAERRAGA